MERPPRPAPAVDAVTPTAVEELIAGIWAEVLGRESVHPGENFFALGGHSLLGTQVMSRLRDTFGVELPVRKLFEAPTVAGLAHEIEAARSAGTVPLPPIARFAKIDGVPLSFAQERLCFLDRLAPGSSAYNLPPGYRLLGPLDVPTLA